MNFLSSSTARVIFRRSSLPLTRYCNPTSYESQQRLSTSSAILSENDLVTLASTTNNNANNIAILRMHRSPANSLSMEMMQSISSAIQTAEADPNLQALILTSSLPNGIFSAGLELTDLYQPDPARLPEFWQSFQQLYLDLYGSRLSTIAAIGGPAPAAGCMLALSCDYRVMIDHPKSTIGLNESQLGIVAPPWLAQQYIDTIGNRNSELALLLGSLFTPTQALDIGLVDELTSIEALEETALQKAADFVRIPSKARVAAKELTRGTQITKLSNNRDKDTEYFCSFVTADTVQRTLGGYLEMLAKRKK